MPLPAFGNFRAVFLETTKSGHNHGGAGWEFRTCVWSPIRNEAGARYYQVMEEPVPGDLVLHNYHFAPPGMRLGPYLCGTFIVERRARTTQDEPNCHRLVHSKRPAMSLEVAPQVAGQPA